MPYCSQCAQPLAGAAKFCPACGAPVVAPVPASTAAPHVAASCDVTRTSADPASAAPPSTPGSDHGRFEPGTRLGTRYRIVALLGRGGMGEVYRADDLELGQSVALKFLPSGIGADPRDLARFRNEVRVARQIAHPNVCRVYDIGEADGHVFLSMEYIDGEDLSAVLRRMGRPTEDKAIEIARQVTLGLAAAHEAGMLHRDLKPANIMIDGRGRARITDFGLAGLAVDLARGGQVAGTPAYMAPEQFADGTVSVRSDVYSLGLVLYELFTGKRAFDANTAAELRQQHDSSSITSPSLLARGVTPAVERLILHCLEREPDRRPASAYAVLGALPGGDPLAAAIAAGETPSPELVANAGDRGSLSPLVAVACVAAGLLGIGLWAGILGPEFRPLTQPPQRLSVRADDLLQKTGAFGALPAHTLEGFEQNAAYVRHLRTDRVEREAKHTSIYFWRRWSPQQIKSPQIHAEIADVHDPPWLAPGQATVMLDPEGRLIGLRAVPPDTMPAFNEGKPAWGTLWAAAGLDSTTFASAPLARPAPAACDSSAAWAGPVPWLGGEQVTVQMGASRGRLTHFTIVHDWGATTAPIDTLATERTTASDWMEFLLFGVLGFGGSVVFAIRNLKLGRIDWRGASRIAVFVYVMNVSEAVFATRLAETGLLNALQYWVYGRALGHALMHSVQMWFAYVALEPYVRRLWPRMLVSWARLVSGRVRDPLVGRDVLIGAAAGALFVALTLVAQIASARAGIAQVPTLLTSQNLVALVSLGNTGDMFAYAGSICVLQVLELLVLLFLLRLLIRRTWAAIVVTIGVSATMAIISSAQTEGLLVVIVGIVAFAAAVLMLIRLGLLTAVVASFVGLVMAQTVGSFDLSSWYADRALVPLVALVGLLVYGAATALAGKSILGDPLEDGAKR